MNIIYVMELKELKKTKGTYSKKTKGTVRMKWNKQKDQWGQC